MESGNLECVKYVIENGGEWGLYACERVAERGFLEILKYAHKSGCEFGNACVQAAKYGHLECVKYIHKNGGTWYSPPLPLLSLSAFPLSLLEIIKYIIISVPHPSTPISLFSKNN